MIRNNKGNRLWQLVGFKKSFSLAILATLPGMIATSVLLYVSEFDPLEITTILVFVTLPWLIGIACFYSNAISPWKTVANILMSFREGDYSIRASAKNQNDAVGLVLNELNSIADYLHHSRRAEFASRKLMQRLLAEIDVAVFLFDNHFNLVMVNAYGAKLYGRSESDLLGNSIADLELTFAQFSAHSSSHEHQFPKQKSRWLVKNSGYRQHGLAHQIILLADIGENLRAEELVAWQKLIRILSHEINNAMTPLKTTAGSMNRILKKDALPQNWRENFLEGIQIIDQRVDNLTRLVSSYAQVSRLPQPNKKQFSLKPLLLRVQASFQPQNIQLQLASELDIELKADAAQLEQVLINLLKNSLEANKANGKNDADTETVLIHAKANAEQLTMTLRDNGAGIENLDNLFIPYFTTKVTGNGIGLFVSRQIIEAHGGSIDLRNRKDHQGCIATICLPLKEN